MKFFLFLLAVVLSATGLPAENTNRIFGGAFAYPGQFPYLVSITETDRHYCSGFIYSTRWIITTASCVTDKTISKLKVIAGQVSAINPDVKEQKMTIYSVIPSPLYNSTTGFNDITLVELTTDIDFDYVNVDFISYNEAYFGATATAMGWGATFEGGVESANLRYGEVDLLPMDSASTCGYYDPTQFNFATMLCTAASVIATPAGSPCEYDEGSPLVQFNYYYWQPIVVGILSKTDGCMNESHGVYIRVSIYYSWIVTTAGPQPIRPTSTYPPANS